tara:strand:- start:52 stop:780 length:729 start_codon:yes stop_codon:yes gene_type:complete
MNVYQFSHYDKNRTIPFCPMDTKKLWRDNSQKYPNDKTTQYYTENPIEYKFNNYGFRTPDDFNDDEGNIFLGCSHTIGIGHHLENTWSYKLNQSLGGKFWNLSQGGSGVDTAFRLLYGFKDSLNVKNIFHFAPTMHKYRYEFIIDSQPRFMNIMYDNGKHAKRFLGNMFVEQSLVDDKVAQINYDKSILAIQSMAKNMNCNYYFLDEKVMDFKDDASIKARDFEHYTINQQNHLYQNFLKII